MADGRTAGKPGFEAGRGRESTRPGEIPKPGWRDILIRTKESISTDNVGLVAAGMAFYGLLAMFPAIAALVSIYGLFADPAEVRQQLQLLSGLVPERAQEIIGSQMERVAGSGSRSLSFAAAGGILLALWGTTKGVKAFMQAMNIAYGEEEKRGLIRQNLVALALTLFVIVLALLALVTIVAIPAVIDRLGLGFGTNLLVTLLRWPLIAVIFGATLAVFYRYTPSRAEARWRWVSPGSIAAIALWLVASMAFSVYLRNFDSYNETYGSLGAVVAMMMWLWLTAFTLVLGAELNAEIERQTRHDSTTGTPRPMGMRGAHAADTVGEVH
ncbi:MAG: YihY family inner membrane protein [Alphaproteobacteria bacterium]|nr:YihY family inner membrane protein [Alphaproteobacteria bacterium]